MLDNENEILSEEKLEDYFGWVVGGFWDWGGVGG
jgi:hypothetical protein